MERLDVDKKKLVEATLARTSIFRTNKPVCRILGPTCGFHLAGSRVSSFVSLIDMTFVTDI